MSQFDDLIGELDSRIESLRRQLKALEKSRDAVEKAMLEDIRTEFPFAGDPPIKAARYVLSREGPMPREDLEAKVIALGVNKGKPRSGNVRIGIDTNLKLGNLVEAEGRIALPEQAKAGRLLAFRAPSELDPNSFR